MRNRAQSVPSPVNPADDTRPETAAEHSQRFLNDIDRATWNGNHPPSSKGPKGIVHKIGLAEHVPHIYKPK